jgi:hypothetical protein
MTSEFRKRFEEAERQHAKARGFISRANWLVAFAIVAIILCGAMAAYKSECRQSGHTNAICTSDTWFDRVLQKTFSF